MSKDGVSLLEDHIDHGSFLRQAFSSTEEERNSTEAIAINKECPRSIGLRSRFRADIGLAAIRDVFFPFDRT